MTAHLHAEIVPGCYRCDLGRDEEAAATAEQAADKARQAACPDHEWIEHSAPGPGDDWRECRLCGAEEE